MKETRNYETIFNRIRYTEHEWVVSGNLSHTPWATKSQHETLLLLMPVG